MKDVMQNIPKKGSNFRRRTSIFLILFGITLGFSGYFVTQTQIQLDLSSERIREFLVPMRSSVQAANSDLRLQIQELKLITQLTREENISVENLAMVRLGPNVVTLQNLKIADWAPESLRSLLRSWTLEAQNYTEQITLGAKISGALDKLSQIQRTTEVLERTVEREISVQLLRISEDTSQYLTLWGVFFAIGLVWMILYFIFVWRWTLPLQELRDWIARDKSPADWAPRSLNSSGLFSGASDFAELVEAIRGRILKFQEASAELSEQSSKNRETQRAITLLFTSLQVTIKKNEELVAELIQKEKLASMGEMAAQLAHEIRNPLNSLGLKLELLMEDAGPEQKPLVQKMTLEIDRLNALTESHLRSTKAQILDSSHCQLAEVVESTKELLREELNQKNCSLVTKIDPEIEALLPANVIKAVLLNLIKNSIQAYEGISSDQPKIISATANFVKAQDSKLPLKFYLEIGDNGCGFPESYDKGSFKIFQTTKKDGSGLGLSTSKSMLEAFGASLEIVSDPQNNVSVVRVVGPTTGKHVNKTPSKDVLKEERPL